MPGDVVRVVEPMARRGARSIRPQRSTHRLATCGGLVDRADGDLARALAAYHDGWDGSSGRTWPPVTRAYVSTILRRFGGPAVLPSLGDAASMRSDPPAAAVLRLVSLGSVTPNG